MCVRETLKSIVIHEARRWCYKCVREGSSEGVCERADEGKRMLGVGLDMRRKWSDAENMRLMCVCVG